MSEKIELPVLALRGNVAFPGTTVPIAVGSAGSLRAVEEALRGDRRVFAVSEREEGALAPSERLYGMGVIAHIGEVRRGLGGMQLLLTPKQRATALDYRQAAEMTRAVVRPVAEMPPLNPDDPTFRALYREVRERSDVFGKQSGLSEEVQRQVLSVVEGSG